MGQTADQLRNQVDQKRQEATDKIEQIEQQVAHTAEQVKDQLNWRHQVEEKPLLAVGIALVGGMLLGGAIGGGNNDHGSSNSSGGGNDKAYYGGSQSSGISGAIRKAAKSSGFEDTMHGVTSAALATAGDRLKDLAHQYFPNVMDKMESEQSSSSASVPRSTSLSAD